MDILFFALVAAFIAYRYYSILGKKDDSIDDLEMQKKEFKFFDFAEGEPDQAQAIKDITPITTSNNEEIIKVMSEINNVYPEFNESYFINGSKKLFELIINAYSEANITKVKEFISSSLYHKIINDLNSMKALGETLNVKLIAIDNMEIIEANIYNNKAFISLKILSEQVIAKYNKDNQLIAGHHSKTEQIEEVWKLSKDLTSAGPNWLLEEII